MLAIVVVTIDKLKYFVVVVTIDTFMVVTVNKLVIKEDTLVVKLDLQPKELVIMDNYHKIINLAFSSLLDF